MLIKFGFSRFAEDSCEHTMPPASVCRFHDALEIYIKPHLRDLNVIDASLGSLLRFTPVLNTPTSGSSGPVNN